MTSIKRNILTIEQNTWGSKLAKGLSGLRFVIDMVRLIATLEI